ncbi:MAG: SET domain-containing protein-lysine N-methyltransferase [Terrimonas sp.]|nr:SET domain-containing protein-lysine N-methyltransferase [Terrimonas sp.]
MHKTALLQELENNTWVMIKPSPVDGIGVFAIRNIPRGTRGLFSKNTGEWIPVSKQEVSSLPPYIQKLVENYCLYDETNYFIPDYGFKVVDLVNFLNHSQTPNIISINDGEDFEAIQAINEGEELFLDYGTIVDSEE